MALLRQFFNKKISNTEFSYSSNLASKEISKTINGKDVLYYQVSAPTGKPIIKIGYNCEPKGGYHNTNYPIFIYQDNNPEPIEILIGETLTYEAIDTNIQKVDIPAGLEYSLDIVLEN